MKSGVTYRRFCLIKSTSPGTPPPRLPWGETSKDGDLKEMTLSEVFNENMLRSLAW